MVETARPKVSQPTRHQDYIMNMDQMPVFFSLNEKKTYEVLEKMVHIQKATADTKRATLALTVTASGKTLTPRLIFKGTPNGRIAKREKKTWPTDLKYG